VGHLADVDPGQVRREHTADPGQDQPAATRAEERRQLLRGPHVVDDQQDRRTELHLRGQALAGLRRGDHAGRLTGEVQNQLGEDRGERRACGLLALGRPEHAAGEAVPQLPGDLPGQRGLADAAGPVQRDVTGVEPLPQPSLECGAFHQVVAGVGSHPGRLPRPGNRRRSHLRVAQATGPSPPP
jgi:hypothetical protein